MAVVSITGAQFTVEVGATPYTDQVTSGTVTTTPTVVRTKTLGDIAFNQTDVNTTVSIEALYDANSGMFDALQTAIAGEVSVALEIVGGAGTWTGTDMWIESAEVSFEAAGVATMTVSFTGTMSFS